MSRNIEVGDLVAYGRGEYVIRHIGKINGEGLDKSLWTDYFKNFDGKILHRGEGGTLSQWEKESDVRLIKKGYNINWVIKC